MAMDERLCGLSQTYFIPITAIYMTRNGEMNVSVTPFKTNFDRNMVISLIVKDSKNLSPTFN